MTDTYSNQSFPVCVKCYTYNQINYIQNALDGFCVQKTNFPFVCCIVDDASTDGEQEVIRNYLQNHFNLYDETIVRKEETDDFRLIFAQHSDNKLCFFAVLFLKYNHYSIKKDKFPYLSEWQNSAKYEATCEGDDYWIDSLKLQKQYDVLENHPDCSIAFCKIKDVSKKGTDLRTTKPNGNYFKSGIITLGDFLKFTYGQGKWVFQTSGYFYRLCYFEECSKTDFKLKYPVGDEPLVIEYLIRGNGYYIDDICSCYRVQSGGHTSSLKSNPELVVLYQKSIIEAVSLLDENTHYKYHKYIEARKLIATFYIDYFYENFSQLFRFKYWRLYFVLPKRTLIIMLLRILCPPLYWKLKKYRFSH